MLKRENILALLACAFLAAAYALTAHFAWKGKSATFDEPVHFVAAWAQTHDADFFVDVENPPLWKYFVAAGTNADDLPLDLIPPRAPEGAFSYRELYQQSNVNPIALIAAARIRMILLTVTLGAMIAWWAWRLAGPVAAVVAMAFFCLDPNFLAHGPLVKNDVPMALSFLALMAAVWLVGENATPWRVLATCLLMGAAVNVKFSGPLGFPMLAAALLIRALLPQPWPVIGKTLSTRSQRLAAAGIIFTASLIMSFAIIWACYDFRFAPSSDGQAMLQVNQFNELVARHEVTIAHGADMLVPKDTLAKWEKDWRPHGMTSLVDWMNDNHLLPQAWLMGFLFTYASSLYRPTFFCGELGIRGWWFYFPAAMAFKTPLTTIAAILFAAFTLKWWQGDRDNRRINWLIAGAILLLALAIPILLFPFFHAGLRQYLPIYSRVIVGLLIAAAGGVAIWALNARVSNLWPLVAASVCPVIYMFVAMDSHLNLGIRHIFPIYPFLYIFLGIAAAASCTRWPRAAGTLISCLIIGLAIETYSAFPDFIPFFNAAVGGSSGGFHLLSDSNLDWGQELPDLAKWQQAHTDRPLYLLYFGSADPGCYKIDYAKITSARIAMMQREDSGKKAVFAISAVTLQATYVDPDQIDQIAPFRTMKPFQILGGSLYLFDTPPAPAQSP